MANLSQDILDDGKLLQTKFLEADEMIRAGELDFKDFSSRLVRKVIFLQKELSRKGADDCYERQVLEAFGGLARHFLTELKDGTLTQASEKEASKKLNAIFPRFNAPNEAVFRAKFSTRTPKKHGKHK